MSYKKWTATNWFYLQNNQSANYLAGLVQQFQLLEIPPLLLCGTEIIPCCIPGVKSNILWKIDSPTPPIGSHPYTFAPTGFWQPSVPHSPNVCKHIPIAAKCCRVRLRFILWKISPLTERILRVKYYNSHWFLVLPMCHLFLISLIVGSLHIKESRSIGLILKIPGSQSTIDLSAGAESYLPQVFGSLFNIHSSSVDMVFNAVNLLLLRLDAKELWVSVPAGEQQSANTHYFNSCNQDPWSLQPCSLNSGSLIVSDKLCRKYNSLVLKKERGLIIR